MHLNFIIRENGDIQLAQIFTDERIQAIALTADGELLENDDFYILPSHSNELLYRTPEVVEQNGFPADKLRELQNIAIVDCDCDFPHLSGCGKNCPSDLSTSIGNINLWIAVVFCSIWLTAAFGLIILSKV